MRTAQLKIANQTFNVWIASTPQQQELGLMNVQPSELADNQGMIFVFPQDQTDGFWMKDTLIPLDIAFIRQPLGVLALQFLVEGRGREERFEAFEQPGAEGQLAGMGRSSALSEAGIVLG